MKKIKKIEEDLLIEQENKIQIVDEYANRKMANIHIKRKKEAYWIYKHQKKIILLREESDNEKPKENEEKKKQNKNKSNKNYTLPKNDPKYR